MDDNHV